MYGVNSRRPDGSPRRTWLESVEADMAVLEIDKEDVHDRKKWRRNVMKRKSTSDVQVSNKHNTQIPGPAIYTDNPDSQLTQT